MITLLTGQNTFAIAEALDSATRTFKGQPERFDASELEPHRLPDLFIGATLFSTERLIVLRDVSFNKPLWTELEKWVERIPDETTVFFIESNPDKRTKTYKLLQKHATIQEFKDLSEQELVAWLQTYARAHQTDLQPDVARYFVQHVGHDQWRLSSELKKVRLAEKPITQQLIQDVVEPYPEASAFELLDSVFRRDTERVEALVDILSAREDPYQFFGLLSSQVSALLAVSVAGTRQSADIARDMGIHPFVVSKLAPVAKRMGRPRIEKFIDDMVQCDMRIKTSGIDPWKQLRQTLLATCVS